MALSKAPNTYLPCPSCGSPAGNSCRSALGRPIGAHKARRRACDAWEQIAVERLSRSRKMVFGDLYYRAARHKRMHFDYPPPEG